MTDIPTWAIIIALILKNPLMVALILLLIGGTVSIILFRYYDDYISLFIASASTIIIVLSIAFILLGTVLLNEGETSDGINSSIVNSTATASGTDSSGLGFGIIGVSLTLLTMALSNIKNLGEQKHNSEIRNYIIEIRNGLKNSFGDDLPDEQSSIIIRNNLKFVGPFWIIMGGIFLTLFPYVLGVYIGLGIAFVGVAVTIISHFWKNYHKEKLEGEAAEPHERNNCRETCDGGSVEGETQSLPMSSTGAVTPLIKVLTNRLSLITVSIMLVGGIIGMCASGIGYYLSNVGVNLDSIMFIYQISSSVVFFSIGFFITLIIVTHQEREKDLENSAHDKILTEINTIITHLERSSEISENSIEYGQKISQIEKKIARIRAKNRETNLPTSNKFRKK